MVEEAYAIGQLAKTGWKPKRTIIYASWDGEEPGLLGSTEWAEEHAAELARKAIVYINSDGNSRGFLNVGGSHSLQHFVNQVGQNVTDPQTGVSVIERSRARHMVQGNKKITERSELPISPLGSGSDYTPFLQHLGISSLNIGYGGEGGGGVYHSRYDSYDHFRRFGDPSFEYEVALSKTAGRAVLRFASADIIPHRFADMTKNIRSYVNELKQLVETMRTETKHAENLHRMNSYVLAADPETTYFPPSPQSSVPYINFAPLENAVAQLDEVTADYDKSLNSALASNVELTSANLLSVNMLLQSMEQRLRDPNGLPRRPWYKHRIYAPGYYTGYGVKTLPGVREAIEQRNWEETSQQITLTAEAISRYAGGIEEAAEILK